MIKHPRVVQIDCGQFSAVILTAKRRYDTISACLKLRLWSQFSIVSLQHFFEMLPGPWQTYTAKLEAAEGRPYTQVVQHVPSFPYPCLCTPLLSSRICLRHRQPWQRKSGPMKQQTSKAVRLQTSLLRLSMCHQYMFFLFA